jgi:hypothetical protein
MEPGLRDACERTQVLPPSVPFRSSRVSCMAMKGPALLRNRRDRSTFQIHDPWPKNPA